MKFFFDNNISPHLAHGIRELSAVTPKVEAVLHLTDRFARDAPDLKWIGDLCADGPWYIVSIDRFNKQHGPSGKPFAAPVTPFLSWTVNGPGMRSGRSPSVWSDGGLKP
ncbi:MAG TPA: hypothetical protein VF670_08325 [Duganella sp.]